MAIGDGDNDLRRLASAGCCIAMGNAREIVRQQATWTAPSNEEDGVAWAIEKFALSGASDGILE